MIKTPVYKTLAKAVVREIDKIKGSRFIAFLEPAENKESAEQRLRELRKEYPDATHHCFAYTTGATGQFFQRYSDDGEPAGTAGRPILQVLEGREIKNALLVVVRYYGGTKLGTGGLVKAYTEAAIEVADAAEIITVEPLSTITLNYEYPLHNLILQITENYSAQNLRQEFTDKIAVLLQIKEALKDQFIAEIIDKSHGQVIISEESD